MLIPALAILLTATVQAQTPEARRPRVEQEPIFSVLAGYTFDGALPPTGPDTFRVIEKARGQVVRTPAFRFSGSYSVELQDQPGDGDFPELQGYFERRETGQLFAHFAFLTTDPEQTFNIALAGPRWFALQKDGLAFWLENRGGTLVHMSDSIPKRLLSLAAFTWYQADLLYDLDRGSYDLAIFQEGVPQPLVSLVGQPNATSHKGSAVDKFSFIGDRGEDTSAVVYYVDDILIAADTKVQPPVFMAPGRRKLFVELFAEPPPAPSTDSAGRVEPSGASQLADHRYFQLMDEGSYAEARDFALTMAARPEPLPGPWAERAADAQLLGGEVAAAGEAYRRLLPAEGEPPPALLLKLADVAFLSGDLEEERTLRERIYGRLRTR